MAPELWPNDELTRLANRYSSDKGTAYNCAHGYTRVYQALLAPLRESPLRMLEIGLVHAPHHGQAGCQAFMIGG